MDITEIEDILCPEAIKEICQSGCNDAAVKKWTEYYSEQILNISSRWVDYINMLENYGFEITGSMQECLERSVWIAAWNVFDSNMFNEFVEKVENI